MPQSKQEYDKLRYATHKEKFRLQRREHYLKNKATYKRRAKTFTAKHRELVASYKAKSKAQKIREARQHVDNIKSQSRCADCGFDNPICLDFHHLDRSTKKDTICRMVLQGLTIRLIQEEIAKCVILCANCHRLRHHLPSSDIAKSSRTDSIVNSYVGHT